jgi:hypothetical protein
MKHVGRRTVQLPYVQVQLLPCYTVFFFFWFKLLVKVSIPEPRLKIHSVEELREFSLSFY